MRLLFGLVFSFLASLLTTGLLLFGCARPARAEAPAPADQPALARGRAIVDAYYHGRTAELWPQLLPPLQQVFVDQPGLDKMRAQLRQSLGDEQLLLGEEVAHMSGLVYYVRHARFTVAGPLDFVIAFDAGDHVAGMRFVPQQAYPSKKLAYHTRTPLRLPFDGTWKVFWGGRELADNQHAITRDQRFAYDLYVERDGASHRGEGKQNRDYYCWGRPILAPGAGRVVATRDGMAENVPGEASVKEPLGNHVILDHGDGEYSFLAHLLPGSVAVKPGDRVVAGQLIGRCGNSGHSSEPHLHYHLQDSPRFADGDGLPAQFRDFLADGAPVVLGEPRRGQTIEARTTAGK